jgi:hypothetical protein
MMTTQEARAAVEAEFRELKRTETITRKVLRELCVTLCDRFPFASGNRLKEVMGRALARPVALVFRSHQRIPKSA